MARSDLSSMRPARTRMRAADLRKRGSRIRRG